MFSCLLPHSNSITTKPLKSREANLKMTVERESRKRQKGRKDEFSDEIWKQMGSDWGIEIHCCCRNSSEEIIKSSPSYSVKLIRRSLSWKIQHLSLPSPAHSFLQSVPQVTTSFPLRSSLSFCPCLVLDMAVRVSSTCPTLPLYCLTVKTVVVPRLLHFILTHWLVI